MENFYPSQYLNDSKFDINHNYLKKQFEDYEEIFLLIEEVIKNTDYTLGKAVDDIENLMSKEANTEFAVGVGSGTDALFLSLKALGIGYGDEVITTTYTFFATVGAIATAGAKPVFCDVLDNDYNLNPEEIISKINSRTKAIIPVHWAGRPCDMDSINQIASEYNLYVIEDACHALQGEYKGKRCGSLGDIGCFSFHPLKNLNVWGDGGMVTTNNEKIANKLKLIRNHGLVDRNTCIEFGYNSRLDTIQAVVARYVLSHKIEKITESRIQNSHLLDELLKDIPQIRTVKRSTDLKEVFHLYMFIANDRDGLSKFLNENGVDAKVHYPIPMHLQPAAKHLNYNVGDFPIAEELALNSISLPVHEFISEVDLSHVSELIHFYYKIK